jgi:myo-inositol-hexaphosphate 3-phosphohydrolase
MKPILYIKLNAGNDRNGNPRRVFIVFDEHGCIMKAIDEGYGGDCVKVALGANIPFGGTFITTVSEYKDCLKQFG